MLAGPQAQTTRWELYRILAEPVRLRLLALAAEEELTIGELATLLDESQPNVSRHLAPLKQAGLVIVRRQGTRALARMSEAAAADPVDLEPGLLEGIDRTDVRVATRTAPREHDSERPTDEPPHDPIQRPPAIGRSGTTGGGPRGTGSSRSRARKCSIGPR